MNKKAGLLLILILGSLMIAAIIYYVFFFSNANKAEDELRDIVETLPIELVKVVESQELNPVETKVPSKVIRPKVPLGQASLERMAKSFAERFGSFSNQSSFANISDLRMVMSNDMQKWADNYIKKNKKSNVANDPYYGMTTKALSTVVQTFDDGKGDAVILVQTRRREAVGSSNNSSALVNQDILITFIKEKQAWKVDSAYWQD